ncbi:polyribonucleotide nucleotidyltransferase [Candidatus Microgenomates bacterium]|nr:polyribonucleotide nucleotidyltransferase [Candidatus Microgenomates bacterium]
MIKLTTQTVELEGKKITFEVGRFAQQATSAVIGKAGDTMVLATVVEAAPKKDLDYFPLSVEYVEKLYAGGRIKGSRWVKREGRPSDEAILKGRLIDRSIRPLFPKNYKNEVQVVVTILSVDGENEPDILAINTVSAALAISSLPWKGPVAALRVGYVKEGEGKESCYLTNPTDAEMEMSELDLVVSSSQERVVMIEAGANQLEEKVFAQAFTYFQKPRDAILKGINDLAKNVGQKKKEIVAEETDKTLVEEIEKKYKKQVTDLIPQVASKEGQGDDLQGLADEFVELKGGEVDKKAVLEILDKLFKKQVRERILKDNQRPDGRDLTQVRPIEIEVGILPRTHGSAMFKRGQTQALSITTLGAPSLEQYVERMEGEETKRYMHHYYMPPYSVGEAGRIGVPSRREVGHGALAERAIIPVLPSEDAFPYAIRVVSEIMSSNGSTSMASTCGSSLSLMDAGVPIIEQVAGIACGLVTSEDLSQYKILTDIVGIEDFSGDMDFKVAGTKNGITAVQLDVKIAGLTQEMIEATLIQSKEARMSILEKMNAVLPAARKQMSKYAPKIKVVKIDTEKIGEVIGPGGKVIRNIMAQTNTTLDVSDDGMVSITGTSEEDVEKAVNWVTTLTRQIKAGEEFEGEVKRILPFGAFVELVPGKEGMVHVSQMSVGFVGNPNDVVQLGQKVKVRVLEIDDQGRINLSMLFGEDAQKAAAQRPQRQDFGRGQRPFGGDRRGPRRPRY